MAERGDAKLLQILRIQGAQDGSVDVIGLERLDVALQANSLSHAGISKAAPARSEGDPESITSLGGQLQRGTGRRSDPPARPG